MKEAPLPLLSPDQGNSRGLRLCALSFLGNGPYTLDILPGECVGLMGRSGVGKTQLLRAVADVIAHRGDCLLDGTACSAIAPLFGEREWPWFQLNLIGGMILLLPIFMVEWGRENQVNCSRKWVFLQMLVDGG